MNTRISNRRWAVAEGLLAVLICEGVGLLAAWATQTSATTWYPTLTKPFFTPPDWVFAPVWIVLYAVMGIAAVLVRRAGRGRGRRGALVLFGAQLLLNGAWSFAFFWARSPAAGGVVIGALLGVLTWTTVRFYRIRPLAGWLLMPYLLWVAYAAALNAAIWALN